MLSKRYRFHLLLHSAHLLEERLRARLTPLGIQPRQARILDALNRMGQASQVALTREFALSAASMSTMSSRLIAAGLIDRHVDERECRSNVLRLTERGRQALKLIHREWGEIDREIEALIGVEQTEQLTALTYHLRSALGGFTPGSNDSDESDALAHGAPPKSSRP